MTDEFLRFPHTPHIAWLGDGEPRNDKILSPLDVERFLSSELCIEEKVDGANVGFSIDLHGELRAQNRGAWIDKDVGGQFKHLWKWMKQYEDQLKLALDTDLILFGEWCYAEHTIGYEKLPNWFIGFDLYSRSADKFYSVKRRDEVLATLGIPSIEPLARRKVKLNDLKTMLNRPSAYGANKIEGIYLRKDNGDWLEKRAKLVRGDFTQTIDEHWSRKPLTPNKIQY
ncbi:MAG: RNA ligase family protein [Pseudoalteromonas sp.]|uniref:RNA ligase family protein n=1 Tax=Pseudoalteromonas sp. TaxID=53249 RepID=UPI001D874AD8|nr:RNA ligase family protein [Pseudoalteromonas sp.]NRA81724.1 RNA ligase family protein [Pseudoalteromonas sp.]